VKDAAEPITEEVKGMVQQAGEHLQPMAQEIRGTASEAAETIRQSAEGAREGVAEQATQSGDRVAHDTTAAARQT